MIPVSGQPNGQGGPASATAGTTGGVGGPAASPPGGTPKNQRRQRPPQTFAGMQQQGVARPSPAMAQQQAQANAMAAQQAAQPVQQPAQGTQMAQPMQTPAQPAMAAPAGAQAAPAQGGNMIGSLGSELQRQIMQMLADPTQGLNEAAMSNFDRQQRLIGQQFADTRESLNENLAARGLDASTIAASGLSRLEERQGQALTDSSTQIQEQLLRDRNAALNNAIQSAMGLRGQEITLDQNLWDRGNADRNFDLQAELGRGNLDINRQNLGLQRDRFGYEKTRDDRNFNYQVGRDTTNDAFRDKEFGWRQGVDQRDYDYRAGQDTIRNDQWNRGFERDQTWRNEDRTYRDDRDKVTDERWNKGWERDQTWRNEDTTYRSGRDTIGDERWNKTFDAANKQQGTQNMLGLLQGMGFNNISPAVLSQIMSSLGLNSTTPNPTPYTPPVGSTSNTGTGATSNTGSGYQNSGGELGTGQYPGQARTMNGVTYTWNGNTWERNGE